MFQDVLEFVDVGCSNFLSNLSLFVTSYRDLFLGENRYVGRSGSQKKRFKVLVSSLA